ncbi:MAG: hypothetical protein HOC28_02640 [Bacteroidetes Order II. Incertae sedis bacterium]|jgi:hypothetical protein|nr:hypothetical protein [Bacteroidetes Order II. bacterium]MBT4602011.1 hypothetical protein [Bacteroidetes Order II. bacterium]MBT5250361.1 hypothetical protein [Bacteroidetes Order II. bacterium]MBT6201138.1 hypothetical protein [Bacteroidetes Order II. bacterium]MBT6424730.1 hypothetical protein [Bacteroidetes Order II. bacterium]
MSKEIVKIPLPKSDVSKSLAGFLIALFVGAFAPRVILYVARRVFTQATREVFTIVAAGFITDQLLKLISGQKRDS